MSGKFKFKKKLQSHIPTGHIVDVTLTISYFQLQLQLTDAYFPVVTGFQLQLLLTGITLLARCD